MQQSTSRVEQPVDDQDSHNENVHNVGGRNDAGPPRSPSPCSSEESINLFLPLMSAIDFAALAMVALKSRIQHKNYRISAENLTEDGLQCFVREGPLSGSFNLVYALEFSDGVKWIARIPGNATSTFGPLDAQKMLCKIRSISLIRSRTSVPAPEIFAWDTSPDSIGVPFTLEAFVEGSQLAERWTDKSWTTEEKRLKVLRDLAKIMSGLRILQFDKIGALYFKEDERRHHVDELVKMETDVEDEESTWGTAHTVGPFDSTIAWLLNDWDDSMTGHPSWRKAELAILHLAIDSIPAYLSHTNCFVLGHPDYNYQNIFVDEEANITGIVDWDDVSTRPRALGFARYPSWITRDWDPSMYGYGIPGSREEDSPETLLKYRREYTRAFAKLQLPASQYSLNDTKLSHLMEAIEIAVDNLICRPQILLKLLSHAFDSDVPFTFPQFSTAFQTNKAETWLVEIKEAFGKMWHPEWKDSP
ncbi:MAG: hypothetical protein M1827_006792 [Pycnora praestabilis]|nr:MAG: hypothetical protein M1827_006792 [Pycnora praestabilis]